MTDLRSGIDYTPPAQFAVEAGERTTARSSDAVRRIADILRRFWRPVAVVVALSVAVAVLPALLSPSRYTARSSFIPYSQRINSMFSGLAERLGVDVGQDKGQSPAFYADLVLATEVLRQAVTTQYDVAGAPARKKTLIEAYDVRGDTPALREESAMERLRENIIVGANQRTGLISLSVTATDPQLAQQVNARLIDRVNSLNLQRRQSQGAAERRFTEARLDQLQGELHVAEDRYAAFLSRNRGYQTDPELVSTARRLEQEVSLRRQMVISLAGAAEQAKLDEVRDTPNITVIDPPNLPARADPRGLALKLILGVVGGLVFGAALAFVLEARRSGRLGPSPASLVTDE